MQCVRRGRPGRLIVWDTKGEFAKEGYAHPVSTIGEVTRALLKAGAAGRFRLAFQPSGDTNKMKRDFSRLCLLAFHAKNCWLIAEELAEVTQAGWAPEGWRKATTQGRSEGLTIYGLSQAPAWIDKYFFGNCTSIRTGRLVEPEHAKKMALTMGESMQEIQQLPDGGFIHMTVSPREVRRGKVF
jgi:hypothetical protein